MISSVGGRAVLDASLELTFQILQRTYGYLLLPLQWFLLFQCLQVSVSISSLQSDKSKMFVKNDFAFEK